jgi:NADPH2:quinone reductase
LKAIVCREYGPPDRLVVDDLPPPVPGAGEVVITVKAASVNFPDTLIIQNRYQVKPPLPFTPGAECAGIVKSVGDGVTQLRVGDRVMAVTTYGSFAEEVQTAASRVMPIPEGMDFTTAGAFMLTYGTSGHALCDRGAVSAGETVLVLGAAGGAGLAAVEISKALGARVIACASSARKLALCVEHGADETINYADEDLRARIRALTSGRGVDVVYDPVGGPYTEPALRSLTWRGRLLVVGFAAGEIPNIPMNLTLLKGCSIVRVFWTGFVQHEPARVASLIAQLGQWYRQGALRPHVSETLPLERAPEAIARMAARAVQGKIVLLPAAMSTPLSS